MITKKLSEIKQGQSAYIEKVGGEGALRQHLLDMGVIPGAHVKLIKFAPMGDPMELRIHGYELTLRLADAEKIEILITDDEAGTYSEVINDENEAEHPGLGEEGRYHVKDDEDPLLPGVTVDRKDGVIKGHPDTLITDLPGIYSMSPYSGEELVSRDFVLKEKPKAIINIVDVTSIDRSMYLTEQLLEMGLPMVVALNMMDEMTGNGGSVDINRMEQMLGVPVVPISAAQNQGVDELVSHAIHVAKYQEGPMRQDFCDSTENGGAVHRCLHAVAHLIEDHAQREDIPVRFAAAKLVEGDQIILDSLKLDKNEKETLEHLILQMERERGLDRSAAMADMRYSFIYKVCDRCIKRPHESKEHIRSSKYDSVLTGKYTAIPVFIAVMAAVFFLTFAVIGPFLQDLLQKGIDALGTSAESAMNAGHVNHAISSLVMDGIFEGVGSVLSFLPIIVTMFFFLSMLEDSGYIARVAFVMDKPLRKIGLSGRSIVPMLIGFGCTVPAVMATRTLPSSRDRRMTILLTPFMSCTAKLPIYGFFVAAFFPGNGWWIVTALYLLGVVTGILSAIVMKKTVFKGEAVPLVMELPNYRLPSAKNVGHLIWDKSKDFLQRAFSVILVATIVVWFLQSFDFRFNMVADAQDSMLAAIAGVLAPVFRPVGLGDWRIVTALISGFMAKESVVATMNVLFAGGVAAALSTLAAASMLVFSLLYTPCVAAVAAIRRELGSGWALYVVLCQCAIAWVAALIVRLIGLAIGLG